MKPESGRGSRAVRPESLAGRHRRVLWSTIRCRSFVAAGSVGKGVKGMVSQVLAPTALGPLGPLSF